MMNKKPYLLRSDANVNKEGTFFRRMSRKLLIGRKISYAAAILTIGTQNRKYYELFGGRQEQFFLAPWEIDYEDLEQNYQQAADKRQAIREEIGLDDNDCAIVVVGRLLHLKGYDTLIPAISKFPKENSAVKLVIVGDGPYRKDIEQLLIRYNLSAHFCGNLDRNKVIQVMTASDIFVISSYREAWGLVVNEAALCGLPLITSAAVGASNDLVVNGLNGYVYPPYDSSLLYKYLANLVSDKNMRKKMGENSRRIIAKWRKEASALEGYKKVLAAALNNLKTTKLKNGF